VSHLGALVAKGSPGVTVVDGDAGDPDAILDAASGGLDLGVPTCLIMGFLLHFYDPGRAAIWPAAGGTPLTRQAERPAVVPGTP